MVALEINSLLWFVFNSCDKEVSSVQNAANEVKLTGYKNIILPNNIEVTTEQNSYKTIEKVIDICYETYMHNTNQLFLMN